MIKYTGNRDAILMMEDSIIHAEKLGILIAFSLIHDGEIIAIGGIYELWPGVGEAFSIMSDTAFKYPKSLYCHFKLNFGFGISHKKYTRIQSMVKVGFDAGVRFIERLGFEREGVMEKWGPDGCDYYIYKRIF
ncbi:MAG: hypothetical protein JW944_03155 [Deltaproteobacteria bacterium]|nr:hypothetical protein [Deltaproteobacteria bacterium]